MTLATAPIYQDKGLVAISPTSTSVDISKIGNYIFRTVPSDRFGGNALARYALEKINKSQVENLLKNFGTKYTINFA